MTDVASEVYRALGDYRSILPSWLEHPGVLAYVEESAGGRRGFILLGFYQPIDLPSGVYVADLLAIAVHPSQQRKGLGRVLLQEACERSVLAGNGNQVAELRLTVADGNEAAQRLFRWGGFRVIDDFHGAYDGGQRAIRMARPLSRQLLASSEPGHRSEPVPLAVELRAELGPH